MNSDKRFSYARFAVIVLVAIVFFVPLWWMTVSAFRPTDAIFRYLSPLSPWSFFPRTWTLENITGIWYGNFGRAIFNSIFITLVTVVLGLAICSTAAFALAVIEFPFRKSVFMVMVISFLIPFDAIAVPLYGIMRMMNLQNTYTGLILPGIGNGLAVFLLRQFFLGIPKELREAAFVDGMGWFGIYWRVYLPLSGPAMLSAALILFVFQWQAYLWPLLIAPAPDYKVAAVAIAQFSAEYNPNFGLIFAASLVISVIPMIVLTVLQRYYSTSVASTGGKE
ncbi:carbohydrate ABC transporter permease [Oceaniovalibus sp. ACAM 378]|uniref:carbohydrate ABC transporter permease n=1 Tax=Oceaniovalibus sp. ACAM 378 TaxID=2599923 RepID=UPI0011D43D94|nr:carbohydrate ABC transporter permease [Oceaniovalibus sp. ACAM 378]TYB90145.1 carbohydrate ABC transporter permease [Oceaniovalibus sp. ACAM 378]